MPHRALAIANFRVSSDEQPLNGSIPRQEAAVRKASNILEADIVRAWSGSVSSKKWNNIERKDLKDADLLRHGDTAIAGCLAWYASLNLAAEIEFFSNGSRDVFRQLSQFGANTTQNESTYSKAGWGTVRGTNNFKGFV